MGFLSELASLSQCAAERVCELLDMSESNFALVRAELNGVLKTYDVDKLVEGFSGQPKSQKAVISKISLQIAKLEESLVSLAPEFAIAISSIPGNDYDGLKVVELVELMQKLAMLREGAVSFLSRYEPAKHRPADLPLELAVRALLSVIEDKLGFDVRAGFKKAEANAPTFYTPGSLVMREVLLASNNPPSETAIVNMLHGVRKRAEVPRSPMMAVIEAHSDPYDLSLLPRRREKVARKRAT
jgi:hypothetical protein